MKLSKNDKLLMKKTMTKNQIKEFHKKRRSQVGLGMKLGTREIPSPRNYDRKRLKKDLRSRVGLGE